jgi:sec-independent protein translocase protein TatA
MVGSLQHILAAGWLPGGWEWLILLAIVLLVFGAKRLPELARSVGKSMNEFKKGMNESKQSADEVADDVKKTSNGAARDAEEVLRPKDSKSPR